MRIVPRYSYVRSIVPVSLHSTNSTNMSLSGSCCISDSDECTTVEIAYILNATTTLFSSFLESAILGLCGRCPLAAEIHTTRYIQRVNSEIEWLVVGHSHKHTTQRQQHEYKLAYDAKVVWQWRALLPTDVIVCPLHTTVWQAVRLTGGAYLRTPGFSFFCEYLR